MAVNLLPGADWEMSSLRFHLGWCQLTSKKRRREIYRDEDLLGVTSVQQFSFFLGVSFCCGRLVCLNNQLQTFRGICHSSASQNENVLWGKKESHVDMILLDAKFQE